MVPGVGQRIPSLDGLRAVSISLVLLAHLSGTAGFVDFPGFLLEGMSLFGVRVFFVISAFLITSLLLQEDSRTGTVSLRHFYLRRTLRIFRPSTPTWPPSRWWPRRDGSSCGNSIALGVAYTTNYHPIAPGTSVMPGRCRSRSSSISCGPS